VFTCSEKKFWKTSFLWHRLVCFRTKRNNPVIILLSFVFFIRLPVLYNTGYNSWLWWTLPQHITAIWNWPMASISHFYMYYEWQKYCSLSYVSDLSNLKTGSDRTKKQSMKSIDRVNTCRIMTVLYCCISFCSQVMKLWKIGGGSNTFAFDGMIFAHFVRDKS